MSEVEKKTFGEILGSFKNKESVESCIALMDNDQLRNSFLAWSAIRIKYITPMPLCEEVEEVAKWDWMWDCIEIEKRKFGIVAGINGQDVENTITRLMGLRLIYPDGSQNTLALMYIKQEVKKRLGLKSSSRTTKKK